MLLLAALALPETLPPSHRRPLKVLGIAKTYLGLFRDVRFIVLVLIAALAAPSIVPAVKDAIKVLESVLGEEAPELAAAIYDAGPGESLRRLAAWLTEQDRLGALAVPDPVLAAEMFSGMTLGHGHLRVILGVPQPPIADVRARAQEVARRFIRAFAAV